MDDNIFRWMIIMMMMMLMIQVPETENFQMDGKSFHMDDEDPLNS
jgi:hypothetical protein